MKILKSVKSILVKLVAALALAFVGVVASQNVNTSANTQTVQAATHWSKKNLKARAWIVKRESGGNWHARNGNCYGRYQLLITYLHHNYSHKNQTRVADNYVRGRYGSWVNAKKFWQRHHWY
ncbi:aggregation promoting factor [Lactobacillus corticis]|uniref:Aggregation promoting factor n=1 Tax=Lactobacillus corticis TaxID=2201249 RepID=A0A916QIU9_9LACO|nr:aggregation promoting factor [Lactobacillus corticis]